MAKLLMHFIASGINDKARLMEAADTVSMVNGLSGGLRCAVIERALMALSTSQPIRAADWSCPFYK